MDWMESGGGPFVLVPSSRVQRWSGAAGGGSDYALACGVADYAGVVAWAGVEVLVLGDAPLRTVIWTGHEPPVLVRWMYAPGEQAVMDALRCLVLDALVPVEEAILTVAERGLVLFDAAEPGSEAETSTLDIAPGRYRVLTFDYAPGEETRLLLHVFRDVCKPSVV